MKRYEICIDLPDNIKHIREYIEKKVRYSNVIAYFEVELYKIYPAKVKKIKTVPR